MKAGQMAIRGGTLLGLIIWAAIAFWIFSFSYSDSFFLYSLHSRLPPFVAAFLGALALPFTVRGLWSQTMRGRLSPLAACLCQVICGGACVVPLAAVSAVLCRASGPWRLSGDDAMGVGIDLLMLALMAVGSVLVLAAAFVLRHAWHGGMDAKGHARLRSAPGPYARRIGPRV